MDLEALTFNVFYRCSAIGISAYTAAADYPPKCLLCGKAKFVLNRIGNVAADFMPSSTKGNSCDIVER